MKETMTTTTTTAAAKTKEQYIYSILFPPPPPSHNNNNNVNNNNTAAKRRQQQQRVNKTAASTTTAGSGVIQLWKLRDCAISEGGFLNDSIRKLVWPLLLGLDDDDDDAMEAVTEEAEDGSTNINKNNNDEAENGNNGNGGSNHQQQRFMNRDHHHDNDESSSSNHHHHHHDDDDNEDENATTITALDELQIDLDASRSTWHLVSAHRCLQLSKKTTCRGRKKMCGALLKKRQRRLGEFLKLTLRLSDYCDDGGLLLGGHSLESSSSSCKDEEDDFRSCGTTTNEEDGGGKKKEEEEQQAEMDNDDYDDCGCRRYPHRRRQRLRYYQGYHDVGSIILSTLGQGSRSGGGSNNSKRKSGNDGGANATTTMTANTNTTSTTTTWADGDGNSSSSCRSVENETTENAPMKLSDANDPNQPPQPQQRVSIVAPTSVVSMDLLTSNPPTCHPNYCRRQQQHQHPPPRRRQRQQDYNTLMNIASSKGLALACRVLLRLSRSHFRDAMKSDFSHLQAALRLVVLPLLAALDPELHSRLASCGIDQPYFCLPWVIAWFAHDVRDTASVKRLFDFFLVSHPLMAAYMSVAMVLHPTNREEVMRAAEESGGDFCCVHGALAKLPRNSSRVGWCWEEEERGVAELGNGGRGRGCNDSNGSSAATGIDNIPKSGSRGNGNRNGDDAANHELSLRDTSSSISISGDWNDSFDDEEESESCRSRGREEKVPFQELIDLSISLMHKIPPRNLIHLSRRYHSEITLQPLMAKSSSIMLLQPPPAWALASSVESSARVLYNKWMREEAIKLNRHQRKNRRKHLGSRSGSGGNEIISWGSSSSLPGGISASLSTLALLILPSSIGGGGLVACVNRARIFLLPSMYSNNYSSSTHIRAIVASGTGPDGLVEARKFRKRRRFIVQATAFLILSMLVMTAKLKWNNSTPAVGEGQEKDEEGQHSQMKILPDDETWACVIEELKSGNFPITFENNNDSDDTCGADISYLGDHRVDFAASSSSGSKNACDRDCGGNSTIDLAITQMNTTASRSRAEIPFSRINDNPVVGSADVIFVVERSITQFVGRCLDHAKNLNGFLSTLAKNSSQLSAELKLKVDKHLRYIINFSHRNGMTITRIQQDLLSWRHSRFFAQYHQFPVRQMSITVFSALSKALNLGLKNIERSWCTIVHEAKEEFVLEFEGTPALWADDATQAWRRREASLRNHARAIMHSVSVAIEDTKIGVMRQDQSSSRVNRKGERIKRARL